MPGRKKNIGVPRSVSKDMIRVAKSDNTVKLFAKFHNKWYATPLQDALVHDSISITNQHQPSTNSVLTFTNPGHGQLVPRITANMQGQMTFFNQGKSQGVTIKENGGALQVRNKLDSAYGELVSGNMTVGSGSAEGVIKSQGDTDITIKTGNSTTSSISIVDGAAGAIMLTPDGAGTVLVGGSSASGKITSRSGQDLELYTLYTGSSKITVKSGTNGDIDITTNGDGVLDIDCQTVPTVTLNNQHSPVADQKFLILDQSTGAIGYRTATQLKGDVGGISASSTFSDVLINKDRSDTDGGSEYGLQLDMDATGNTAGGATQTNIAFDLDLNSDAQTNSGTVHDYGLDIDVVGGSDGTSTATGIDISCTGADTNTHLKLSHDSTNYCSFTTIANGVTTIETADSDGAVGHLTLAPNGNLLSSAVQNILTSTTADQLVVRYDGSNYGLMNVASDGHVEIEAVGTAADITLNAAASIYLNADGGNCRVMDGAGSFTPAHADDVATKAYVDGKKFSVHNKQMTSRMGYANTYYVSNQTFGLGVAAADFGVAELQYAVYLSSSAVTLQSWIFSGYVSNTEPYELELWDVTIPSNGATTAATAAKIGSTVHLNGGTGLAGDVTASRIYTQKQTGIDFDLAVGHALYFVTRYTDGSGNKTIYGALTMEFETI